MKIVSVVGARPQFIKLAMMTKVFHESIEHLIVHTGQHYDYKLSDKFFSDFKMPQPRINLGIGSGSHAFQTSAILKPLEDFLKSYKPDWTLNFGDTNTTLGTTIVTSKLGIKSAHIEAGLRSGNRKMPEEVNRIVADHLSDLNLAPSEAAMRNLEKEGLLERSILVGDIMVDALHYALSIQHTVPNVLSRLHDSRNYLVATFHREELTSSRKKLTELIQILSNLEIEVFLPAHPRLLKCLDIFELKTKIAKSLKIIPPLGYFEMIKLIYGSKGVITDSGGVQKEAYLLKKPCLTVREDTEWIETLKGGWNQLVWNDLELIKGFPYEFDPSVHNPEIFGDGKTSHKVLQILSDYL
jgi:UDP-N-acetylglucosamine 2-epimerase (non-hydrolysing)